MRLAGSRDLFGGSMIFLVGLAFLAEARGLDFGSARRMGPGFFPTIVGIVTCLLAVGLIITGTRERLYMISSEARPLLWVMVGTAAFAPTIRTLGLVPAVFLTVAISSLGDSRSRPLPVALLGIGCATAAWAIFIAGLGLPIPALRVPF